MSASNQRFTEPTSPSPLTLNRKVNGRFLCSEEKTKTSPAALVSRISAPSKMKAPAETSRGTTFLLGVSTNSSASSSSSVSRAKASTPSLTATEDASKMIRASSCPFGQPSIESTRSFTEDCSSSTLQHRLNRCVTSRTSSSTLSLKFS